MDRHTKMNAKVLIIWLLALAAIWLLWGCKCGRMVSRNGLVVDSTAQSEEMTVIEVLACKASGMNKGHQNTDGGLFARIANKMNGTQRETDDGGLKPTERDGQRGEYAAHQTNTMANIVRGENEGRKAERGKRRRFAAQRPVEPTLADQECAGVVADLIENGGGVVKITRTKKATSTTDRQQQQLDRVIKQRNDWVFFLGVVVAVAIGTRALRK